MRLLLLTLEKHKDGIWVTRLVNELECINTHGKFDFDVTVQIVAIERILHQVVLVDSNSDTPNNNNNNNDNDHIRPTTTTITTTQQHLMMFLMYRSYNNTMGLLIVFRMPQTQS